MNSSSIVEAGLLVYLSHQLVLAQNLVGMGPDYSYVYYLIIHFRKICCVEPSTLHMTTDKGIP